MKGYTIQHSIDLLEKAVENSGGGSGGGGTAADVSYSNTSSGLVATNVQNAIDEVVEDVGSLESTIEELAGRCVYTSTEKLIGKWGDDDLYQSVVTITALPSAPTTGVNYPHGIANIDKIKSISGVINFSGGNVGTVPYTVAAGDAVASQINIVANATNLVVAVGVDRSSAGAEIILKYTKTAPTRTSKKK